MRCPGAPSRRTIGVAARAPGRRRRSARRPTPRAAAVCQRDEESRRPAEPRAVSTRSTLYPCASGRHPASQDRRTNLPALRDPRDALRSPCLVDRRRSKAPSADLTLPSPDAQASSYGASADGLSRIFHRTSRNVGVSARPEPTTDRGPSTVRGRCPGQLGEPDQSICAPPVWLPTSLGRRGSACQPTPTGPSFCRLVLGALAGSSTNA